MFAEFALPDFLVAWPVGIPMGERGAGDPMAWLPIAHVLLVPPLTASEISQWHRVF